ncbi:stage II sporulation protein M [Paenibacillus sp. MMS18-CY102]|uniref:stage II sporulation protein M n=1 Tax=Paenibacillus sp. MMS18-CY102 TaxID=2682849 RepID=UPI001F1D01BC|nr:stage II sporulation protein M [Paenibacillus sp. MMS18-CY102]
MNSYFILSAVLFLAGIVAGTTSPGLNDFMNSQLESIRQVAEKVNTSSNPTLFALVVIFFNNAIKFAAVIYLGFFFGIFPLFFLIVNGMIIGYLCYNVSEQAGSGALFDLIFKGLLPHGIIEIPVLIITAAYGLKSGSFTFRWIGSAFKRSGGLAKETQKYLLCTVPVLIGIVLLVIESTVTVWLLGK